MRFSLELTFDERAAWSLLAWLSRWNAMLLLGRPDFPLLYDTPVVYRRESGEHWLDAIQTLLQGFEDCDGLSAWRVGEVLARGPKAICFGDPGYDHVEWLRRRGRRARFRAWPFFRTWAPEGQTGLYHCLARYYIDDRMYVDDPSLRLGMRDGYIDPVVLKRREHLAPSAFRDSASPTVQLEEAA